MQSLTNVLANLPDIPELANFKPMSPEEFEKFMCDYHNNRQGELTGYDCTICKNKGYTVKLVNRAEVCTECKCMSIRKTIHKLETVGLGATLEKCKFQSFHTDGLKWREDMLRTCLDFVKNGCESWLFLGGQSQSGKTHLCTAVCGHMINAGRSVEYLLWTELKEKLEAFKYKNDEYEKTISDLKQYDVLYLDDFLKTTTEVVNGVDVPSKPSPQELVLAYIVINARSLSNKKTIISSEHFLPEIVDYESATGMRIHNKTQNGRFAFNIGRNPSRRYSLA